MRGVQAGSAGSASIEPAFSEVSENRPPTALAGLRIVDHVLQRLAIAFRTLLILLEQRFHVTFMGGIESRTIAPGGMMESVSHPRMTLSMTSR